MADVKLHQALTAAEQAVIEGIAANRGNLDCLVKYIDKFILEDAHLFGLSNLIFRYGMPGKFPNGQYGYLLFGDTGVYNKPEPIEGDWRVTMRALEIPFYEVRLNSLQRIQCKITSYYDRDRIYLQNPNFWLGYHLSALARALPTYLNYIVYKVFVGTKTKEENWPIKDWLETYIEEKVKTNGLKFYGAQGWNEINLLKVIDRANNKPQDHKLGTKLDDINKALRGTERKIEVDDTTDATLKTDWIKNNVTPAGKKVLALFNKVESEVQNALNHGFFDKKYKHKLLWDNEWGDKEIRGKKDQQFFEGYNAPVNTENLAIIVSQTDVQTLKRESRLKEPFTGFLNTNTIAGVTVYQTALLDPGEAFVIHRDLLQFWIMPQLSRYFIDNYKTEQTRDYIYEITHTHDIVPLYPSVYFKLKA